MCIIEVHVVDPQLRQGLVEGLVDILWFGIYYPIGISMSRAEFRCKEDFVALSGFLEPIQPNCEGRPMRGAAQVNLPFSNELFVVTINVSSIPEGTPRLVNSIQDLSYERGSAVRYKYEGNVCFVPSNALRLSLPHHRLWKGPYHHIQWR